MHIVFLSEKTLQSSKECLFQDGYYLYLKQYGALHKPMKISIELTNTSTNQIMAMISQLFHKCTNIILATHESHMSLPRWPLILNHFEKCD